MSGKKSRGERDSCVCVGVWWECVRGDKDKHDRPNGREENKERKEKNGGSGKQISCAQVVASLVYVFLCVFPMGGRERGGRIIFNPSPGGIFFVQRRGREG